MGSYKCTSTIHPHVVTKILREEDYDDDNEDNDDEDENNDDDYGEEITEIPQSSRCENGFKKNENLECVGKCTSQKIKLLIIIIILYKIRLSIEIFKYR